MNKVYHILLLILFFVACNRTYKEYYNDGKIESEYELKYGKINGKGIYYNKDGTIKRILYFKNGIRDSLSTEYYNYKRDKIKTNGFYNNGLKQDWWTTYDSASQRILEETYYYQDKIYTLTQYDNTGKCKYTYIRPRILDDRDTISVDNNDSIYFDFSKKQDLNIIKHLVKITSLDNNESYGLFYIIIYPSKFEYIPIDAISNVFKNKNNLYYIEIQALQAVETKLCCCDSIECGITSKYVYIKYPN